MPIKFLFRNTLWGPWFELRRLYPIHRPTPKEKKNQFYICFLTKAYGLETLGSSTGPGPRGPKFTLICVLQCPCPSSRRLTCHCPWDGVLILDTACVPLRTQPCLPLKRHLTYLTSYSHCQTFASLLNALNVPRGMGSWSSQETLAF